MNIGSIKQNDAGIFIGRVSTLTVVMTIALREVLLQSPMPLHGIDARTADAPD